MKTGMARLIRVSEDLGLELGLKFMSIVRTLAFSNWLGRLLGEPSYNL